MGSRLVGPLHRLQNPPGGAVEFVWKIPDKPRQQIIILHRELEKEEEDSGYSVIEIIVIVIIVIIVLAVMALCGCGFD